MDCPLAYMFNKILKYLRNSLTGKYACLLPYPESDGRITINFFIPAAIICKAVLFTCCILYLLTYQTT